jgi:hypothetical protein
MAEKQYTGSTLRLGLLLLGIWLFVCLPSTIAVLPGDKAGALAMTAPLVLGVILILLDVFGFELFL